VTEASMSHVVSFTYSVACCKFSNRYGKNRDNYDDL